MLAFRKLLGSLFFALIALGVLAVGATFAVVVLALQAARRRLARG